jgi:hypothetical protein
MQASGLIHEAM